jgi:multisubunit Na+/H+ antiporter MnhB subunit
MRRKIVFCLEILLVLLCALIVLVYLPRSPYGGERVQDYLLENGLKETGAPNLVSALYLRYRNYTTLAETLLFFLSISGVVFLLGPGGKK